MVQLAIGTDVEQAAGGIVGAGDEGVAIGEELDGVDVGLVAGKGLDGLAGADVPELGESIASTGDEGVLICGVDANAHDVAEVVGELGDLGASLDVPLHAGHVAGRGEDASVVDEPAAGEVTGVARELSRDTGGAITIRVQVVDGADVVETTAGDVVPTGSVGAGHHPRGAEGDGVDLVGGVGVPDDELAVLRRRDEMPPVGRPVHGIDLGQMSLERLPRLHHLVPRERLLLMAGDSLDWKRC